MSITEGMRAQFEAAFTEEMVKRCGEGFRSSVRLFFVEKEPDGTYSNPIAHAGWWAWQASRDAVVVELPEPDLPETSLDEPIDRESEEFRYLEARHGAQWRIYQNCRKAIEAQGLKVAP